MIARGRSRTGYTLGRRDDRAIKESVSVSCASRPTLNAIIDLATCWRSDMELSISRI